MRQLIHLLFAEVDTLRRREKKARTKVSKLTVAVAALQSDVADLKARLATDKQADADKIAGLTAENDAVAADVSALSADIKSIDAPATPASADTGPAPVVPALPSDGGSGNLP